ASTRKRGPSSCTTSFRTGPRRGRRERFPDRRHRAARGPRAAARRGIPPAPDRRARRARGGGSRDDARAALSLGGSRPAHLLHRGGDRRRRVLDRRPRLRPLPGPLDLMHASDLAIDVLLALGVATELICVAGVLVMRTTFDRLHYAAAATTVPAFLVLAAALVREHLSAGGLQALAAVLLLFLLNPALVIATAHAVRRTD